MYFAVNLRRRARSGTSGSGRSVPAPLIRPGSSIPVARTNVVTLFVISGKLSIPALGSLNVRGQVPQTTLAERGVLGMEKPRIKHCQLLHNDTVCLLDTPCEPPVADESGAPVAVPGWGGVAVGCCRGGVGAA